MIRCKIGWHDYAWKRDEFKAWERFPMEWYARLVIYQRQVGTCSRCGYIKFKEL